MKRVIPRMGRGSLERVEMVPSSPWWGEHRSRYHYASVFATGSSTLDVACGTGFGMNILSDAGAREVVGVDLSEDALTEAVTDRRDNVFPVRADALRMPLPDGSVDLITSFETIEHIEEDRLFLAELKRVLRTEGGLLILSTPNALHTRPVDGKPRNPFHVREYRPDELRALLSDHFSDIRLFGQHVHSRYPIAPFWQLREHLPKDIRGRVRVFSWRIQNRLPFDVNDKISRLVHNRAFHPGEYDFVFEKDRVGSAHVMLALCRI